jgi:hypothetical protein
LLKVLVKLFQKLAGRGAEPLSLSAESEISSAFFFLIAFSFAPTMPKEKATKELLQFDEHSFQ